MLFHQTLTSGIRRLWIIANIRQKAVATWVTPFSFLFPPFFSPNRCCLQGASESPVRPSFPVPFRSNVSFIASLTGRLGWVRNRHGQACAILSVGCRECWLWEGLFGLYFFMSLSVGRPHGFCSTSCGHQMEQVAPTELQNTQPSHSPSHAGLKQWAQ